MPSWRRCRKGPYLGYPQQMDTEPQLHDLVIVDNEPALGVGRFVDVVGDDARLLLYRDGTLVWRKRASLRPCPPGTAVAPDDPV